MNDPDFQQPSLDLGPIAERRPCRYCERMNLSDGRDRLDSYDCCDPSPPKLMPLSELSAEQVAFRLAWQAEIELDAAYIASVEAARR